MTLISVPSFAARGQGGEDALAAPTGVGAAALRTHGLDAGSGGVMRVAPVS